MILTDRYNYPAEFHSKSLKALEIALDTASAYSAWRKDDPGSTAPLDKRYDSIPELTKQIMRDNFPLGLIPNNRNMDEGLARDEIEYTFTSGTTGDRVINIWDQDWWNRSEIASWKLNAHTANMPYPQKVAKLASALNVGISCEEDLPMSHRILGDTLYLNEKINIIQWQPRHYERMAQELDIFQPTIIEANPSLLARLAYWAIDNEIKLYSPSVIIFTFELPSKIHLAAINKVFSSALISSYGTTETGFVLEECEDGFFHQNIDFCRIDFYPLKEKYGGPELGRILVTTFDNPWNSIIKFDVGDLVRLRKDNKCSCGRNEGLIVEAIEGRTSNVTFTTDGNVITTFALDTELSKIQGIRDYIMEQHSKNKYELQLMVKNGSSNLLDEVRTTLNSLYGQDGEYEIRILDNLLPGPAGKFRRTQANFDFDIKELFE